MTTSCSSTGETVEVALTTVTSTSPVFTRVPKAAVMPESAALTHASRTSIGPGFAATGDVAPPAAVTGAEEPDVPQAEAPTSMPTTTVTAATAPNRRLPRLRKDWCICALPGDVRPTRRFGRARNRAGSGPNMWRTPSAGNRNDGWADL